MPRRPCPKSVGSRPQSFEIGMVVAIKALSLDNFEFGILPH